jgi:hypothetical protein
MSFLELLKKTRNELSEKTNIVNDVKEEVSTETNVVNDELINDDSQDDSGSLTIGKQIIIEAKLALANKKLKSSNSCKRLAKNIVKGIVTRQQLNKCFEIQKRHKQSHPNFRLVGGDAMLLLKNLLDDGINLVDALNYKIER